MSRVGTHVFAEELNGADRFLSTALARPKVLTCRVNLPSVSTFYKIRFPEAAGYSLRRVFRAILTGLYIAVIVNLLHNVPIVTNHERMTH
jgi:hypothetical protein